MKKEENPTLVIQWGKISFYMKSSVPQLLTPVLLIQHLIISQVWGIQRGESLIIPLCTISLDLSSPGSAFMHSPLQLTTLVFYGI